MSVHLVTFSDESMSRSRDLCVRSAIYKGGISPNQVHAFTPWEIKGHAGGQTEVHELYQAHREIFDAPRGCGYWTWKPTLIYYYTLAVSAFVYGARDGDVIVYADAGVEFIAPVSHIIDRMDQDIFLFGNNYEHAHWCKRDVIEAVWPWWERGRMLDMDGDREVFVFSRFHKDNGEQHWINVRQLAWERFHKQVQASVIFFRVSDYTREFVKEWLDWCLFEGGRLIDDSPSRLPNHPEFQEHRHDQSILTTLAYREGIKLHWWGARYNMDQPGGGFVYPKAPEFAGDTYEPFVHHHRRRNHEWEQVA